MAVPEQTVLALYRNILNTCLPRSTLPWDMRFMPRNIPYAYPSIKQKCHGGDGVQEPVRTCQKKGHSCMRNIISFLHLPGRSSFRAVGRALRHLVTMHGQSWAVSDLSHAHKDMQERFQAIKKRTASTNHTCAQCNIGLAAPGACTADAGQAYGAFDADFVEECIEWIFSLAGLRADRDKTISVSCSRKCMVWNGGYIFTRRNDRRYFWLSKSKKCTNALRKMLVYKVGNVYIRQRKGLPIGGPISGAILEACLANLEQTFDRRVWPSICAKFGLQGPRNEYIAAGRYADDALLLSPYFCDRCLFGFIKQTYRKQLDFDDTTDTRHLGENYAIKFLDFWCIVNFQNISIAPHCTNELALLSGDISQRKKYRFPWHHGDRRNVQAQLLCDLQGRIARARQLELRGFGAIYFFVTIFYELRIMDHPLDFLWHTWQSIALHDDTFKNGVKAFNAIRACARTGKYDFATIVCHIVTSTGESNQNPQVSLAVSNCILHLEQSSADRHKRAVQALRVELDRYIEELDRSIQQSRDQVLLMLAAWMSERM